MAATIFTWFPDSESVLDCTPNVTVTKFGDYEARVPIGINFIAQKWTLMFDRTPSEVAPIYDFIVARGGYQAFNWVNPDGEALVYVCRAWKRTRSPGHFKLELTFEQVFES